MSDHARALARLKLNDALVAAPRKARPAEKPTSSGVPGTWVRVKAYDIAGQNGLPRSRQWPDHMFIEYDDGENQLIARGGPSAEGGAFLRDALSGGLRVKAELTPARASRDYGKGERTLYETFVPYRGASEVAEPAREEVLRVNQGDNRYGKHVNSNSFVGNVTERQFGRRIGDEQTWGYDTRLGDRPPRR